MRQAISFCLLMSGFVVALHAPVEAQGHRHGRCSKCNKEMAPMPPVMMGAQAPLVGAYGTCDTCNMAAAQCTVTQTRPVVQTELRPQQVTTYCNVTETRVRNETVVQNVPVTTCKTVTVDEGGYQMVWVAKPVTKQVAQTVIQQQVATRAVPYQVTHRVPQVTTQMVPVQTVRHVTETVPVTAFGTQYMPQTQAYNQPQTQAYVQPYIQASPIASVPNANIQTMPAISIPLPQAGPTPYGSPTPSIDDSMPVPTRPSSRQSRDFGSPSSRVVPNPSDEARGQDQRISRFVPAPSAASVWSSRSGLR